MNSENVVNAAEAAGLAVEAPRAGDQIDLELWPIRGATKVEQILQRDDGSEAKIVAQKFFGRGLTCSIDVYVLRRESPNHLWTLASNRPHPDWREMSFDEYIKHGRPEMLQAVSHAEILKATRALLSA